MRVDVYKRQDYVPMKTWRIFLVQLLNIAGLGPIYGAIAGACWGPVAVSYTHLDVYKRQEQLDDSH